jgi:apolipoprotein D and lipocalin family protein
MRGKKIKLYIFLSVLFISGCTGLPEGTEPVSGFDVSRYTGKWYEIARLDHRFERGLEQITAEYTPNEDGGIKVVNRGYDADSQTWKEAEGRAYLVDDPTVGRLKVSFFGPFYGGYNILRLDRENYQYALVSGPNRSYLWVLSRTPEMKPDTLKDLIDYAESLGFATSELIYVDHGR